MGVHLDHYLLNQLQQEPSPVQDGYTERFRIKNLSAKTMKGGGGTEVYPPFSIMITIEICYGLILPCQMNIVNPRIPSKPMLCIGFGSIMMKYVFM